MKKLLFLGMLIASLSVNAQILGDKVSNQPYDWEVLPGMFTTDSKSYIVIDETQYNEYEVPESFSPLIKVLDDELKLIRNIDIPSRNLKSGYEKKRRAPEMRPNGAYTRRNSYKLTDIDADFKNEYPTDDEVIAILDAYWGYKVDYIDEDSIECGFKCFLSKEKHYNYEKYGYSYPIEYFRFYEDSLILARYRYEWDFIERFSGEWETDEGEVYYDKRGNIGEFEWMNFKTEIMDYNELMITQTLFSTDNKYEYIRPILQQSSYTSEYDRDYDGEVDEITTYYDSKELGFEIVNEDGDVLQSIRYESPVDYSYFALVAINDKYYWVVGMEGEEYDYIEEWYLFQSGSSTDLKKVQAPVGVTARPAMAKRHQNITIETTGEEKNRQVNIVDASGKSVWKQIIPAGQKSIRVNASKLSKGLNVVNVDGKKEQSVKVIVN